MKIIGVAIALIALSACSAVQFNPRANGQSLMVTKLDGYPAQLIVSQEFQKSVAQVTPVGKKWGSVTLDVFAGKAVTKSLSSYLSSALPGLRVGDVDDGRQSVMNITPSIASFSVGTDDSPAYHTGMFIPLAQFAMSADVISSVSLSAKVKLCGRADQTLVSQGFARKTMNYSAIGFPELEEVSGSAIDDASDKLTRQILGLIKSGAPEPCKP